MHQQLLPVLHTIPELPSALPIRLLLKYRRVISSAAAVLFPAVLFRVELCAEVFVLCKEHAVLQECLAKNGVRHDKFSVL